LAKNIPLSGFFSLISETLQGIKAMAYSLITFEIEDRVGLICLNRPDDGNALVPEMAGSPDGREGIAAFMAKRPPAFKGK
jgi:enoyl-CoA hydratase/carnithine racemase